MARVVGLVRFACPPQITHFLFFSFNFNIIFFVLYDQPCVEVGGITFATLNSNIALVF